MKQGLLFILFLMLTCGSYASQDYTAWWNTANEMYKAKQYDSAVYYYTKIAALNPQDEYVYYNIGNAHYKLNNIGLAVLNYEKALKINPNFDLATDNLYLTQNRINNRIQPVPKIFFVRWWHGLTSSSHTNTYALLSIVLFLAGIAYLILARLRSIKIKLPIQAIASIFILSILFVFLGFVSANKRVTSKYAVVIEHEAPLMLSPETGKSQSLIPEGTKVEVTDNKTGWLEVILPDGRTGWLQSNTLGRI